MADLRANYRLGLALVTAAAVAWSTSGLFTRMLTTDTPTILFWRGLFGAVGLLLAIIIIPGAGGIKSFRRLGLAGLAYAAITALSMLLFIGALMHTTVAHVAIMTAVVPFISAYLAWLVLREVPNRTAIAASLLALLGVGVMVGLSAEGTGFGDMLAFLMAATMAGMILISRKFGNIPALPATCVASILSAVATLHYSSLSLPTNELGTLAIFGLVNQVLGFGLFALGTRYLPPLETALITALDAPLAPFWVWLLLAETPKTATLLGGALVLIAVLGNICLQNWQALQVDSPPSRG